MRFVLNTLAVTFPFFALVLCGYLATRWALLPQAAIPGLNVFVLYFALPCMLYRFGAEASPGCLAWRARQVLSLRSVIRSCQRKGI